MNLTDQNSFDDRPRRTVRISSDIAYPPREQSPDHPYIGAGLDLTDRIQRPDGFDVRVPDFVAHMSLHQSW